jgi:hypothetical protein
MPSPIEPRPLDPESGASPPVRFPSNGQYVCLITATGSGYSRSGETTLTAWSGDRVEDRQGSSYLRDAESRAGWSLLAGPRGGPSRTMDAGAIEIARR